MQRSVGEAQPTATENLQKQSTCFLLSTQNTTEVLKRGALCYFLCGSSTYLQHTQPHLQDRAQLQRELRAIRITPCHLFSCQLPREGNGQKQGHKSIKQSVLADPRACGGGDERVLHTGTAQLGIKTYDLKAWEPGYTCMAFALPYCSLLVLQASSVFMTVP